MGKTVGVIGAGMVGISAASWLQRDGHKVVVIDAGNPGEGASFGNAGCFNGSSVVPMSMPGMIKNVPGWLMDPLGPLAVRWSYLPVIAPWLVRFIRAGSPERVRAQARALRALLGPTVETVMTLAKDAGCPELIHRAGSLWVYRSEASFAKDRMGMELRAQNGVRVEVLDADQLRQYDPALSRDFVKAMLIEENGHTSNPHRLVQSLAAEVARSGGEIRKARAQGFVLDGRRLKAIRTDAGDIPCEAAVVATGAWSKPLAAELGDRVPLESERGYHIMVRNPEASPRVPTADQDGKFMVTPMETGLRFAGTVELAGLAAPPNWRRSDILLEQGRRMLPGLAKSHPEERLTRWMGHRPSLPDSLPCIGPSKASPDVVYAFGHGHVGMAGSPMTGRVVADLVTGRSPRIDIAPFSPVRFA